MTELSALAGSEGYAACDDDGGLYCQKRPSRAFFDSLQREPPGGAAHALPNGDNVTELRLKTGIIGSERNTKEGAYMSVININKANFQEEVLNSEKPVLLDFWAPWCGPCRMVGPLVDEIAGERADIKVGKVNVDEEPQLSAQFGVMSIPTLVVMKNGKITNKTVGARPKAQILALL